MRKSRILTLFLALAVVFTMSFAAVPAYAVSGTAITSADDLKAMENNPSGSYYLANDIEVPANLILFTSYDAPFTGTLDGNGHTIKGYTYTASADWTEQAALFGYAKNATFKNLKMTEVNISLNQAGTVAALVAASENCKFTDISVSGNTYTGKGKVTIRDNYGDTYVAKVTAVYTFDEEAKSFSKVSLEIDTPRKQ